MTEVIKELIKTTSLKESNKVCLLFVARQTQYLRTPKEFDVLDITVFE